MSRVHKKDQVMTHRDVYSSWFIVVAMLAVIAL